MGYHPRLFGTSILVEKSEGSTSLRDTGSDGREDQGRERDGFLC